MNAAEMRDARARLGEMWGLDRPLSRTEMGEALKLQGNTGRTISGYEEGWCPISGPVSLVVLAMLEGWRPPHLRGSI